MKIKYNWEYDRYVTEDGKVLRYDSKQDKLVLCKQTTLDNGYLKVGVKKPTRKKISAHRLVYETFNGEIPQGYEIDHINTIRDDNRLENLRCVTHKENSNNPLTIKHHSESRKGNNNASGKTHSEFGRKFKEHFRMSNYQDHKLYHKELAWYLRHNHKCRWEAEDVSKS